MKWSPRPKACVVTQRRSACGKHHLKASWSERQRADCQSREWIRGLASLYSGNSGAPKRGEGDSNFTSPRRWQGSWIDNSGTARGGPGWSERDEGVCSKREIGALLVHGVVSLAHNHTFTLSHFFPIFSSFFMPYRFPFSSSPPVVSFCTIRRQHDYQTQNSFTQTRTSSTPLIILWNECILLQKLWIKACLCPKHPS